MVDSLYGGWFEMEGVLCVVNDLAMYLWKKSITRSEKIMEATD